MSARGVDGVVLVVDADPRIGDLFRRAALGLPLEIVQAGSAHEGWSVALRRSPVAVFSDYRLVGCDGITLLERLRSHVPGAQRVLHTADPISRRVSGVDVPVLARPCDEEALRALLTALASPAAPPLATG